MTIAFSVNGARAVIPAVYDYFLVQDSLPAPVPAGRNILIIGEAESGVPGKYLNLPLNFFTNYNDVLAYYKSGPIVDAARQIFSAQPSPAFGGAVNRLYIYKTNDTTRAEKEISSPSNFGSVVAAVWEEDGNLIKSQILTAQSEVLPSKEFQYILSGASRDITFMVSGKKLAAASLPALSTPAAAQAAFDTALGASGDATGGADRGAVLLVPDATVSATGDTIAVTLSNGAAGVDWDLSSVAAGDSLYIPAASAIAGLGGGNEGVYVVLSATADSVTAKKVHSLSAGADVAYAAPEDVAATALAGPSDLQVFEPITVSVTEATVNGSGATLEILEDAAGESAVWGLIDYDSWLEILSSAGATVGTVTAEDLGGSLLVSLGGASFSSTPKAGDVIEIPADSVIAGGSSENVGLWLVASATSTSLTLDPMQGQAVADVAEASLGGETGLVQWQPGFVTNAYGWKRIDSLAEKQVKVEASRSKDNAVWPTASIGGTSFLEVGYFDATATSAKLSINQKREMLIEVAGPSPLSLKIPTQKYASLGELAEFLSAQTGFAARVPSPFNASLPVTVLDMVSDMDILAGNGDQNAYNGKIKGDYHLWTRHFEDNAGSLLAFKAGTMTLKVGLPDAEAKPGFLSGAAVGATSGAEIQAGLDQGLKINVANVVPLFSRDANYDAEDFLTDPASSYSIDAIHAAVRAHVVAASGTLIKKERFGMLSFHGSFEDTKLKSGALAYERLQMAFQMPRAVNSQGQIQWFLPWMLSCCISAGRVQSVLGTSMLRKSFGVTDVKHIGNKSLFDDTFEFDFDPESQGQLTQAIESGLLTFALRLGAGVQLLSPDLSTRSRDNDPQAWVWERVNVLFVADEVRQTLRSVLENFIGRRTTDVSTADVAKAINDTLQSFVTNGALSGFSVNSVESLGNAYDCKVAIRPTEALEFIIVEVTAERNV